MQISKIICDKHPKAGFENMSVWYMHKSFSEYKLSTLFPKNKTICRISGIKANKYS